MHWDHNRDEWRTTWELLASKGYQPCSVRPQVWPHVRRVRHGLSTNTGANSSANTGANTSSNTSAKAGAKSSSKTGAQTSAQTSAETSVDLQLDITGGRMLGIASQS